MINDKNNTILFNEDVKAKFLDGIKEATRTSYERIFKLTYKFESALGKDINNFTLSEIETILYEFKAKNRNTIESYGRIISSYLNWSVENGLTSANVLSPFRPDDFETYMLDGESYIANNKLRRHEDRCANYQDAVILRLLFEGVGGKQLSEIRNLSKKDINGNQLKLINTLTYNDDGTPDKFTERYLTVSDRTISLIEGAIEQKQYTKRNGFMIERDNIRKHTDLITNDYVLRPSITKTDTNWNTPVDKFVIYRRIQVLADTLGIDLTAKFVQRSGMMYFANNLIQNENELTLDDLKIIADKFNMKSYHNLKGFLTVKNIRKTYPNGKE